MDWSLHRAWKRDSGLTLPTTLVMNVREATPEMATEELLVVDLTNKLKRELRLPRRGAESTQKIVTRILMHAEETELSMITPY